MADTLFVPAGADAWTATDYARGPWHPDFCHGGPVAALLTRAAEKEHAADGVEWQLAHLTVELTRPVPVLRELTLTTRLERPGRKVSVVTAALHDGETMVASSRSVRIRRADLRFPDDLVVPEDPPPGDPADADQQWIEWEVADETTFHTDSCEHRVAGGSLSAPGPVAVWIALRCAVVPDEQPTGAQRAAAVADFGNGVSSALDTERFSFINPDLTVHFARPPRGEWIALRAATHYGDRTRSSGAAFAESALYDRAGRFGHAAQSLFVDETSAG